MPTLPTGGPSGPCVDTFGMIAEERRSLADVLSGLEPQQWATPSLCRGWTVHGQDIRRPLGIHHDIDPEHLHRSLTFVAGRSLGFVPKGFANGVRFEATDLDWASGEGAAARGSGVAILLTMAGRRAALADLEGPGVDVLRERLA